MDEPEIRRAANALRAGGVVGIPTDTVYGLAVDPLQHPALLHLLELKGRTGRRPVALLVSSIDQARRIGRLHAGAVELAERFWPGPLTLVVPKLDHLPEWIGDSVRASVGMRAPDHPTALALLSETGPLAVSSANRSGEEPVLDADAARELFGAEVAVYLPGRSSGGAASTVVDLTVDPSRVLRAGPIRLEQDSSGGQGPG